MSAAVEQAARLAMAISDLSPNISVSLSLHGLGVDVTGRLISPVAGYRVNFPLTWADLRRNPDLLTSAVLSTALGLVRTETRFERVEEMTPHAAKALLADGPDGEPWAACWAIGGAVLAMITAVALGFALL